MTESERDHITEAVGLRHVGTTLADTFNTTLSSLVTSVATFNKKDPVIETDPTTSTSFPVMLKQVTLSGLADAKDPFLKPEDIPNFPKDYPVGSEGDWTTALIDANLTFIDEGNCILLLFVNQIEFDCFEILNVQFTFQFSTCN